MKTVEEEIEKLSELLIDNYLLSSAIILATEKTADGTQLCVSSKGNGYEHIGMLEDYKHKLINDL